jgi:hypothetical protein
MSLSPSLFLFLSHSLSPSLPLCIHSTCIKPCRHILYTHSWSPSPPRPHLVQFFPPELGSFSWLLQSRHGLMGNTWSSAALLGPFACIYTCMYTHICLRARFKAWLCEYTHVCMNTHTHINTHTHVVLGRVVRFPCVCMHLYIHTPT